MIGLALALKTGYESYCNRNIYAFTLLYVILGYIFYSAIFVAAGSPATTEQEAQQITAYISMFTGCTICH